jgi:tetratricopeptide (TPR) repeat protein
MGDVASAREFLDEQTAGDDPGLLIALGEVDLREGRVDRATSVVRRALELDHSLVNEVINIGWSFCQSNPDAAFLCIDAASDVSIGQRDFQTAASILQEYVARATQQIPALLKLVEVCVDGGLEATMYETQGQLCDAYLTAGQASEARVIAEDLVAREPWEQTHIERLRHALIELKVSDPDTLIAERLNGQVPFVATDRFVDDWTGEAGRDQGTAEAEPEPPPSEAEATDAEPPSSNGEEEVDMEALQALLREVEGTESAHPFEVDLSSELAEGGGLSAESDAPRSLGDVFASAREEADRESGAEDAAQQLKLGRTYEQTGLHDEAIAAFERAARSPRHRFEAAAALARVYRERGQPATAIEWMERAAEAPSPSVDDGRALLYELAVALEQQGDNTRALAVFLELLADAGAYRDAQARASRLSRVETGS